VRSDSFPCPSRLLRSEPARRRARRFGNEAEVAAIREALDTGAPFAPHWEARSLAEALLQLLVALPIPVVTPGVRAAAVAAHHSAQACAEAAMRLPEPHLTTLIYLLAMVREVPPPPPPPRARFLRVPLRYQRDPPTRPPKAGPFAIHLFLCRKR